MKRHPTRLTVVLFCLLLAPLTASGQDSRIEVLPDSPAYYTYSYNTYTELGWHEFLNPDRRGITGWTIDYTWQTLDGFMGTFVAKSPAGTEFVIGFAEEEGTYNKPTGDFNDEWADGSWIFWVEDIQGYGEQQAIGITVTWDYVDADTPFGLQATTRGDTAELSWKAAADSSDLLGYRIERDGFFVDQVPADMTAFDDEGLPLGTHCYVIIAVYVAGDGGSSNGWSSTMYTHGTYSVPDSPPPNQPNTYYCNSWTEAGWVEVDIPDPEVITGWHITYDWETNWPEEGLFYAMSPAGTQITIGDGLPTGHHQVDSSAFDGEQAQGTWRLWIVDDEFFCDGMHRATNIIMAFDLGTP